MDNKFKDQQQPAETDEKSTAQTEGDQEQSIEKRRELPVEELSREELIERLNEVQETADKNFDQYVRAHAEIDNLKKRYTKEQQNLARYANESLVKALLPVIDNLENALAHANGTSDPEALREGVALTLKGLKDALQKEGVCEVNSLGEIFDPHFHEAIAEQEDSSVAPRTVINELQKGYLLNDRLVRPAVVVVSKKAAEEKG